MKKGVTKLYPYPGRQGRERSLVKKVAFSSTPSNDHKAVDNEVRS